MSGTDLFSFLESCCYENQIIILYTKQPKPFNRLLIKFNNTKNCCNKFYCINKTNLFFLCWNNIKYEPYTYLTNKYAPKYLLGIPI